MKDSHIEWTTHTFNPWIGCTKVSPGCLNCYAEARDKRFANGAHWGKDAPRQRTAAANWRQPSRWNADAGTNLRGGDLDAKPRVFCASLADWLDDEVPIDWLVDLLDLIRCTPNLDWLLLTKRPQNWDKRICGALGQSPNTAFLHWLEGWFIHNAPPDNVWIGTSVEDQTRADERIPLLLSIPAQVRFLSCEPLLGPVSLYQGFWVGADGGWEWSGARRGMIQWVICGGESGPAARPMQRSWARNLRDQCEAAGVSFFFKQWGKFSPNAEDDSMTDCVGKKAAGRLLDGYLHDALPRLSNGPLERRPDADSTPSPAAPTGRSLEAGG